ncbi:MAG: hypothetical protein A4E36_00797 [Methanoregulaceae archaeon PtaB.Bin009]|nr:MAG: hypothetical protein A4E36_00797 [Methanoregulaceae archaeon PtaB.Bin009]
MVGIAGKKRPSPSINTLVIQEPARMITGIRQERQY